MEWKRECGRSYGWSDSLVVATETTADGWGLTTQRFVVREYTCIKNGSLAKKQAVNHSVYRN